MRRLASPQHAPSEADWGAVQSSLRAESVLRPSLSPSTLLVMLLPQLPEVSDDPEAPEEGSVDRHDACRWPVLLLRLGLPHVRHGITAKSHARTRGVMDGHMLTAKGLEGRTDLGVGERTRSEDRLGKRGQN